jgi:hypothetical protein
MCTINIVPEEARERAFQDLSERNRRMFFLSVFRHLDFDEFQRELKKAQPSEPLTIRKLSILFGMYLEHFHSKPEEIPAHLVRFQIVD